MESPARAHSEVAVLRPSDLAGAVEAMRDGVDAGAPILIRGAGTAESWGAPVGSIEAILDTTALRGIQAYNPSDMTVAVGAGTPLSELQDELAEHDQRVALDAARIAAGATVGGLLATADAGPLGHAYGSLRDLVLGATVVLADGSVARTGGHVVKNVAGYDLAKLLSGSLGTLALAVTIVLRVHPRPAHTATLLADRESAAGARALADGLLRSPLEPVCVEWHEGRLLAGFEGTAEGVSGRLDKAIALSKATATDGGAFVSRLEAGALTHAWEQVAACVNAGDDATVFRIGALPDAFGPLVAELERQGREHGVEVETTWSLGTGVGTARLSGGGTEGHAAVLAAVRSGVQADGGNVTLRQRRDGVDALVPSWGDPPPTSIGVWRQLKRRLDPDGRLGPGRFAPWLEGDEHR